MPTGPLAGCIKALYRKVKLVHLLMRYQTELKQQLLTGGNRMLNEASIVVSEAASCQGGMHNIHKAVRGRSLNIWVRRAHPN
jgi:hypothetical protein